jgi:membrane-associated protease RseP (regulator of RpoE activity)
MRRTTPLKVLVLFALVAAVSVTALSAAAAAARPWLGVYTQEITTDLRDGLDLRDNDNGVLVNRVVEDSPADRAGLRKGDLIVRFNSRSVESPEALARMVGDARNGQDIALEILRHGDRQTLSVTLAPRPTGGDDDEDMAPTPPAPPSAPEAPRAPRAPRDADDDHGDNVHRKVHVHIDTPDGEHGTPRVYRFDGDMDKIPAEVHRMLGDMHLRELDGNGDGSRRMVIRTGNRLRLGVRIESLSDDLAGALDAPGREGVLVVEVIQDTPAARAGLKAGDVILGVNDRGVKDAEELQKALREANGKVSLSVSRKGSRRTVEADLGSPSWTGRGDNDEDSLGPGRMEGLERLGRLRAREDAGGDDLRKQLDELRQQLRELRQQLEEQRNQH